MAISKKFATTMHPVAWNGEEAASVRGLTPADVVQILAAEGENLFDLFTVRDKIDLANIDTSDAGAVADKLLEDGPGALMELGLKIPTLLARIICVAANAGDDDEAMESVRDGFPLPLQFQCLTEIARLTFVGPEGFRQFVGNVMALANTLQAVTNVKPRQRPIGSPALDAGSLAFANSVPGSAPMAN